MLKCVQHDGYRSGQSLGRSSGLAFVLLLAACGSADDAIPGSQPIDCRLADAKAFERICTVERIDSPEGPVLVARAPDGGFRRLLIVKDGRGVIAADGAEPVGVRPAGAGHIDVSAGDMVYRLPAKVAA
ncbi:MULTISPECIES: hypothetical protein [unclassified Sphingomonas]|uniref:hypothetical protein n=1 Tax=unclassified Sphingomonas TaxID=196159 RepID=UPI0006FC9506|nr:MULTISPECIES: hypothetical protein [unclassified Sphingomonas]KQX19259.1 hypothetical protein ASD17_11955 [Sphingomonas sp. Root1294]KQY65461.1 hypothetical protein ASD39_15155 [Sphingomonas sp. Root50]KRB95241.1 hypothetical protein ASE22_04900 [Sphingomonas sp. Root720]